MTRRQANYMQIELYKNERDEALRQSAKERIRNSRLILAVLVLAFALAANIALIQWAAL
tara:strand:+ start:2326 stop:2502 length:177 start_codon:yes stop_codon:yes gene_type:complete